MYILLIILFTSIDSLLVSSTYSNNNILVPIKSIITLCLTNIFILTIMYNIYCLFDFKSHELIANIISFILLVILGLYNIFNDYIKSIIKKDNNITNIFKNNLKADIDNSKYLSIKESIYLGIILSIDTIIGGFGILLQKINIFNICLISFIINFIFLNLGKYIKNVNTRINTDIFIGISIIIIAVIKFIFNLCV